jgi:hypothetical protein
MTGHYESDLHFKLSNLAYKIVGTGCGSSGSNGEYNGAMEVLPEIIVE